MPEISLVINTRSKDLHILLSYIKLPLPHRFFLAFVCVKKVDAEMRKDDDNVKNNFHKIITTLTWCVSMLTLAN